MEVEAVAGVAVVAPVVVAAVGIAEFLDAAAVVEAFLAVVADVADVACQAQLGSAGKRRYVAGAVCSGASLDSATVPVAVHTFQEQPIY